MEKKSDQTNFETARKHELLHEKVVRSSTSNQEDLIRRSEGFDVTIPVWNTPKGDYLFFIFEFEKFFFLLERKKTRTSLFAFVELAAFQKKKKEKKKSCVHRGVF